MGTSPLKVYIESEFIRFNPHINDHECAERVADIALRLNKTSNS
jgi:hypothetical protein